MEHQVGYKAPVPTTEISNELFDFVSGKDIEPPRKKQKTASAKVDLGSYILINKSTTTVKCVSSRLRNLAPLSRKDIQPIVRISGSKAEHIEIWSTGRSICSILLSENTESRIIATLSSSRNRDQAVNVQFDVSLSHRDSRDFIQLAVSILWKATKSPYETPHRRSYLVNTILNEYFQVGAVTDTDFSPQYLYQSLHTSNQDDQDGWEHLSTPSVEVKLYPFQKRAVKWCVHREVHPDLPHNGGETLPISFVSAHDARNQTCYVSKILGVITLDIKPFRAVERSLRGGILSDEMGLGKTISAITLITLHKQPQMPNTVYDPWTGTTVQPTGATLIVTPPSILNQWISEVNKVAPRLDCFKYDGVNKHSDMSSTQLLQRLLTSDIVITSYNVLGAEINYTTLNPEKTLRHAAKYQRPKSPLTQLSWWRVCMDEAQMIESGVSKAALVTRVIPRVNAWCITGTPIRKGIEDALGLLIFLRLEPFTYKDCWTSLISDKHVFRDLFSSIAIRHSKRSIRDELRLPIQRRYAITIPFTPIEHENYKELYEQMCRDVGVDTSGAPLSNDWELESVASLMRAWLVRLRQSALHPEIGAQNRRALGNVAGPLRTVEEVLQTMIENTDGTISTDTRNLFALKLKRGQLFENSPQVRKALAIFEEVVFECSAVVGEYREQLHSEVSSAGSVAVLHRCDPAIIGSENDSDVEEEDTESVSRSEICGLRLRSAVEILHMAIFFRASCYFQMKTNFRNEEHIILDSDEFKVLEKLELEGYDQAKTLRRELLQEVANRADRLMQTIQKRAAEQQFVVIPEFSIKAPTGGLESRNLLERLDSLAAALDGQAEIIDEWREKVVQFLVQPLVDQDDQEITGEEYEEAAKAQDEVIVYMLALRSAVADRSEALSGQENKLITYDVNNALTYAGKSPAEGSAPPRTIELLSVREQLKPPKELGSVRGIVADLRALDFALKTNGSTRAQNEVAIVNTQLRQAQKLLAEQTKVTTALEKEVGIFTNVVNSRLDYYRQLQYLSDAVAPHQAIEGAEVERMATKMVADEEALAQKIATALSKRRYLEHLKREAANPEEQRACVICRETFEIGALTVCGHQYCKECIGLWWKSHHTCPVCKKKLTKVDLYDITYKPSQPTLMTDCPGQVYSSQPQRSTSGAIYSAISKNTLADIQNMKLKGPSFTSKVDTLARHIIWLRQSDPGTKCIVYSQFKEFLDVLAVAFEHFRIGFSSITQKNGIKKFTTDPGTECFLLHAKAHSSGLNLTMASNVFLCEPLLNTALELQAIARVDRIGQQQDTKVFLYLVDETVEASVYELSARRRLEHIDQSKAEEKGKEKEIASDEPLDSTTIDDANSLELQQSSFAHLMANSGGGEFVQDGDLWFCLFGKKTQLANHRLEVRRHLAAEIAERRQIAA
ncbi:SNF2 family N-terminal domain-containing protein [Calycina marina]|uniref:SNF2 family N-terminal domain-containing protein n=1 Tax=Calycina marina TaxID=1763456 RepID=A0A9P7Z682_9HELO|nr:SNF2 family N-terminal domain-containing protein [Calycina marina]